MKKLTALLLALVLMLTALPVSAVTAGELEYEYIRQVADFIREQGLYSGEEDDPIRSALVSMLEENPALYELLLTYMLANYDDRTMHIPSQQLASQLQTTGYVGVGVTLTLADGFFEVTALHPEGGAKRAGIEVGDHIIGVAGIPSEEIDFTKVAETLRNGDPGTFIEVAVRREESIFELMLERTLLGEPEYSARELEPGIWLMRWTQFRTTELMEDFHSTIAEMEQSGAKSLILDLRGNGGGLLNMAYEIVESLIPEKNVHYITVSHREGEELVPEKLYSPGGGLALNQIIVLCDNGTASASEIVMAALCDTGYGVSVGTRTYGKATAQYEIVTPTNSILIITAYKITPPSGTEYDRTGLVPDYTVANAEISVPAPAIRLREQALSFGSCSDDSERLNEALLALGLMREPQVAYRLGEDTQAAINNLRQLNGLSKISGADVETIALINSMFDAMQEHIISVDMQMDKAMELAREAAADAPAS